MFTTILKGNTCHEPAGSPKGGQFCSQQLALDLVGGEGEAPPKRDSATYTEQEFIEDLDLAESPKEVEEALSAAGAKPIMLGGSQLFVVNRFDYIVEWDGKDNYPSYKKKADFISEADPSDYFPDEDVEFNSSFWESPTYLYHNTQSEFIDSILAEGIRASSKTRGFTNRFEPEAVYTSTDFEEYEEGSYGSAQVQIDTKAMRRDNYTPFVAREPNIVESELRARLATALDAFDYYSEPESDGTSYNTVAIRGNIPKKYLTRIKSDSFQKIIKFNPYHDSKGRFTTGPGKGASSGVSPTSIHASNALQYGLGSARDEVLSYDDGLEHSVGVDKNGTPFFAKDGEADHVTFTDEEMGMLKGAHLIHNHPNNSGLSIGDVLFAGNCGLKSIEAVTQDGSVFKCVPSKSLKSPQGRAIASITHDLAQETFGPSISMNLFSGYFGHEEANRILGNMTMEVLHELGVFKHSMKLSAETARSEARVPEDARVALKATFYDRLNRSLVNAPDDVKQFIKKNKMFSENLVDPIIYET